MQTTIRRCGAHLVTTTLLLAGCASSPQSDRGTSEVKVQAQIQRRLSEIFDAAATQDFPRLEAYHAYGPKFTKFGPESPARQDAAAARQGELEGLSAVTALAMRANYLQVDVFDEVAIATFVLDYSFRAGTNLVAKQARSTLVFVQEEGEWLITHEHLSPLTPGTEP